MRALLEEFDLPGARSPSTHLHTCRDTERALVEQHGAHYAADGEEQLPGDLPDAGDGGLGESLTASGDPRPGEGARTNRDAQDRHLLSAAGPVALLPETSLPSDPETLPHQGGRRPSASPTASPRQARSRPMPPQLLEWNRGHWSIENRNHYRRDTVYGEDQSRISYPSWAGQQRHHLQRRARDRPPRRIRQRAGIDRPLSAARPRWRRSSPTKSYPRRDTRTRGH